MTIRAPEDWVAVLAALEVGDRAAVARVTNVITGFLARYRAYDYRDSWDDLCQEVLISLIRSARRGALREPSAFIAYTGTITRNALTDWIRRERTPESSAAWGERRTEFERRNPDPLLDLKRALGELPERQRRVVEAIYLQGYSYEAVAKRLGMPFGTLKRLQTEGLKTLRKKMGIERGSS